MANRRANCLRKVTRFWTRSLSKSRSQHGASTASFLRTPWATTSSFTPTASARRCKRDFTFCASRRIGKVESPAVLCRFHRAEGNGLKDYIGAFAVTSGICLKELCDRFRAENDDYNAIMAEALADRLAEAFAECLHKRVREEWGYGRNENLSNAQLIHEEYRGIRPAAGLSRRAPITPKRARCGSCSTCRKTREC